MTTHLSAALDHYARVFRNVEYFTNKLAHRRWLAQAREELSKQVGEDNYIDVYNAILKHFNYIKSPREK